MTQRSAHTPIRTCVGCRSKRPQAALARVVLDERGRALVDRTAPGRGAWLCSKGCFDRAMKQRGFDRALRRPVSIESCAGVRAALPDDVAVATREER